MDKSDNLLEMLQNTKELFKQLISLEEYKAALDFLKIEDNATLDDIKKIHDEFVEYVTVLNDFEADFVCNYLSSLKIVFYNRYKSNKLSNDEYLIWKRSIEDDFSEIPDEIRIKIKKLILGKITSVTKEKVLKYKARKNVESGVSALNEKYSKIEKYDDYIIKDIKTNDDFEYTNIKIHYKPRIITLACFTLIIIILTVISSVLNPNPKPKIQEKEKPKQEIKNEKINNQPVKNVEQKVKPDIKSPLETTLDNDKQLNTEHKELKTENEEKQNSDNTLKNSKNTQAYVRQNTIQTTQQKKPVTEPMQPVQPTQPANNQDIDDFMN